MIRNIEEVVTLSKEEYMRFGQVHRKPGIVPNSYNDLVKVSKEDLNQQKKIK